MTDVWSNHKEDKMFCIKVAKKIFLYRYIAYIRYSAFTG